MYAAFGVLLAAVAVGQLTAPKQPAAAPAVTYIFASGPPAAAPSDTATPTETAVPTQAPSATSEPEPSATIQASRPAAQGVSPLLPPAVLPRPAPTTASAPAEASPPWSVVVYITDNGFVGPHVEIQRGGQVTWVNISRAVHSATAVGPVRPFDTGGLAQGQSNTQQLTVPGTYAYTSAPDCIGNRSSFDCDGSFTVTVD
jgi:plastocyanin